MKQFIYFISKESKISLRIFDFLCTKYLKNNNVIYYVEKSSGKMAFNLNVAYKAQLKAYSKLQFDPFKRHERISIPYSNTTIVTTIGQMNFFKFAIENKLTEWIMKKENLKKIEDSIYIDSSVKKNAKDNKPIQKQNQTTSKHNLHITVTFK